MTDKEVTMNQCNNGANTSSFLRSGISTRSKNSLLSNITNKQSDKSKTNIAMAKRKAEESPPKGKCVKAMRSAFGDLTNNTLSKSTVSYDAKKVQTKGKLGFNLKDKEKQSTKLPVKPKDSKHPVNSKNVATQLVKPAKDVGLFVQPGVQTRRSLKSKDITSKSVEDAKRITKKNAAETGSSNVAPRKTFTQFGKLAVPSIASSKSHGATLIKYKLTCGDRENQAPPARLPSKEPDIVVLSSDSSSSSTSSTSAISNSSASSPDSSLYVSAQEELTVDESSSGASLEENAKLKEESETHESVQAAQLVASTLPANVDDFDEETKNDPFQVPVYAMDVFNYLREREAKFVISDYMAKQAHLSKHMRALLVDWMVEIQETFELNHETLYLAVKLVDLYLSKVIVSKEMMQLIGAASIFIASKFDERTPPLIDDFIYICDGAYSHEEMIKAEINVVKVIDFDLGIPLSYRFLRRYARCAKVTMPILTLARYILEFALMEYSFIFHSDSKLAASALFLALKMKNLGGWTATLEYYTSHKLLDIIDIVLELNSMLHKKPSESLNTVKNKYSHKIFFEVAKTPLLKKIDF